MYYRDQVYVCFDADEDMDYYRTMKMWVGNKNINFDFNNAHDLNTLRDGSSEETIKRKLRERMNNAGLLVVLVGEKTRNLYKYVRWEIEIALKDGIPIVVANLNGKRSFDDHRCPAILDNELALHVSFNSKVMQKAFDEWPREHYKFKAQGTSGDRFFVDQVYEQLGLNKTQAQLEAERLNSLRDYLARKGQPFRF
ncbi:TIR domain-containing protein [Bdellovibrio bacteriovorus]|uniref:Thoeris protein ThsB TIR-like domain-containing protein n=1 Tax=Bdellovibrio bacteriovorus (strain ATCC 15356 / DSM 50701 / NCIMB 9529 / HD100) TaxID=264462 RepID=Q6MN07_BDEBA|nr:TIR domain-containing protein [Bdellovibrio bacteriovorus]CAE79345.1 conserved hypothetical protein [Bdellovibrio bacteriovorus HD100]